MCHQSVGLIARQVEAAGIATLCLSSAIDITRAVNPPRAAFVDFPLGHTAGKPHDPRLQRLILLDAIAAMTGLAEPGSIKLLPYRWSEDESWKTTAFTGHDTRTPRVAIPQYQCEEDRRLAEEHLVPPHCAVCARLSGTPPPA